MTTAIAASASIATEAEVKKACLDLDFCHLSDDRRYEMIDGKLVELPPMRVFNGTVVNIIGRLFGDYIDEEGQPFVVSAGASFRLGLSRANFRIPNVSVAHVRQLPASLADEPRALDGSTDIAVEVISPTDAYVDVIAKAALYLRQGVATVLLVDLYHREVTVRQATGEIHVLAVDDTLTGEPTLPGFSCRVAEIFHDLDRLLALQEEDN